MPIFVHSQSRKKGVAIKFFEEGGDTQGHVKRKMFSTRCRKISMPMAHLTEIRNKKFLEK